MNLGVLVGGRWHAPELVAALRELGHRVEVFSTDPWDGHSVRLPGRLALRAASRTRSAVVANEAVFSVCRPAMRTSRIDAFISWSSFALPVMLTTHRPVVIVRGSTHIRRQRLTLPKSEGPSCLAVILEEAEYNKALFVSVPTAEIAKDPFWPPGRTRTHPYGFPELHRASAAQDAYPVTAVFAGEISYRKGFDRLALLDEVDQVQVLEVIGRPRAGQMALPRKARVLGHLPHPEALRRIAAATFFVLLSREEGMARAGMEAIAMGVPVIATQATGLATWLERGAGIVVDETAADFRDQLAQAVHTIVDKRQEFSHRAYDIARGWRWVDHAEHLAHDLSDIVERPDDFQA